MLQNFAAFLQYPHLTIDCDVAFEQQLMQVQVKFLLRFRRLLFQARLNSCPSVHGGTSIVLDVFYFKHD